MIKIRARLWIAGVRFCLVAAVALCGATLAAAASSDRGTFVMFADFHFNPFEAADLADDLSNTPPDKWAPIFLAKTSPTFAQYGSDSDYSLMSSSLTAVAKEGEDADFYIYGGDFLVHKFNSRGASFFKTDPESDQVRNFAIATSRFVAGEIADALAGKPVIVALGNTDTSCGDYEIEPSGTYLAGIKDDIRTLVGPDLLHDDFDETFSAGGYYGLRHPTVDGVHILVLNNLFWSAKYQNNCGSGPTKMGEQILLWLRNHLMKAQGQGEKVLLLYHVPTGIDVFSTNHSKSETCEAKIVPFWHGSFAQAFKALHGTYGDTILGAFSAHIHHDSFRLIRDGSSQNQTLEKIVPAISPIYGNNPGFHVFSYDQGTGAVVDYRTRYLTNLTTASAKVPAVWANEYVFTKAYNQTGVSANSFESVWQSMQTAGSEADTLFARFNPVSHGQLAEDKMPAYRCGTAHISREAFEACWCQQKD